MRTLVRMDCSKEHALHQLNSMDILLPPLMVHSDCIVYGVLEKQGYQFGSPPEQRAY